MSEPFPPLPLLHEDDDLVAVCKPSGLPAIAARGEAPDACLRAQLERQLGHRLWVVHRIDRDASGLVVFARTADAHRVMSLAFEHRQVGKTYVAFTAGEPPPKGRLDVPLHAARKGKARPAHPEESGSQDAVTEYSIERGWVQGDARVSMVEVRPLTGRHHQIRVHLRSVDAPVLFDRLYGKGRMPAALAGAPCGRLALHARRLEFPAPGGKGRRVFEAPLSEDLEALRRWLDLRWGSASE
jgi:RluA family pseudouridine synthase